MNASKFILKPFCRLGEPSSSLPQAQPIQPQRAIERYILLHQSWMPMLCNSTEGLMRMGVIIFSNIMGPFYLHPVINNSLTFPELRTFINQDTLNPWKIHSLKRVYLLVIRREPCITRITPEKKRIQFSVKYSAVQLKWKTPAFGYFDCRQLLPISKLLVSYKHAKY